MENLTLHENTHILTIPITLLVWYFISKLINHILKIDEIIRPKYKDPNYEYKIDEYNKMIDNKNNKKSLIMLIMGVVCIISSIIAYKNDNKGIKYSAVGFLYAGILIIISEIIINWTKFTNITQIIIIGILLCVLIVVLYLMFNNQTKLY